MKEKPHLLLLSSLLILQSFFHFSNNFILQGVQIPSLGTFTFTQKKLDIGNNKFILIQRPVFNISEKLAQSQALQYVKHHVPGMKFINNISFIFFLFYIYANF